LLDVCSLLKEEFFFFKKAPSAKTVSDSWNALKDDERHPYVALAEEDKVRYSKEVDEYIAKFPVLKVEIVRWL